MKTAKPIRRVSLSNTRWHASTRSFRSAKRVSRAITPNAATSHRNRPESTSFPSRGICRPHEKTRRAPGRARSSTAWAVPVKSCRTPQRTRTVSTPSQPATAFRMTSRSFVSPGKTAIRPRNSSSLTTLRSRHTPTTSWPRSRQWRTMYFPSFPEAPTIQTFTVSLPSRTSNPRRLRQTHRGTFAA